MRARQQTVIPYFSREEINHKQALSDRDLEILWCNDPVSIYFLQVQGSGKADLGDGNIVSVLYDGQNGRPYKSIGRVPDRQRGHDQREHVHAGSARVSADPSR